ncbi:Protoporphyrinogen IX oxidase, aerobic, HemY [Alkalibacterium sp. AK22]|uniref:protoporphyrinogen oxidase n=1 Tax=Alkalibacterium sp. AK22 TaxID=1229520 RepID=UPI00044E9F89|nr:protoporphyrinogen oxidase [Alkalibacterium sp. AK22]EXJ22894.1 Protoporphyrinogen IX oxidase, aerobic, HemY [Alkalibacterium sp. AK22]
MAEIKKRIAVIGSGITGLTTAYRLQAEIKTHNLPYEVIVLEASIRSGGKLYTMKFGEQFIDLGAESIDSRRSEAVDLIEELNLVDRLAYSRNGKQDIFAFNKLYHMDCATYKGIPVKRSDIWKYDIVSFQGKLSFLKDTYFSKTELSKEVTARDYLAERVGDEVAEYVAEPFFAKIYSSDIDEIGIHGLNEPLVELEEEHGTLTRALEDNPQLQDGDGNYVTFDQGLETLTRTLTEKIEPIIRYSKKVTDVKKSINETYLLDINKKEQLRVNSVVVATDSAAYNQIFSDIDLSDYFKDIKMGSIGFVLFSFPKGSLNKAPKGNGVLLGRRNNSYIQSVVWLNKKWAHFADRDEELLGIYFGRSTDGIMMSLSNKQIEEAILKDLNKMLGIRQKPNYRIIKRWPNAIPQFTLNHEQNTTRLSDFLKKQYAGLYLVGNGMDGFGINNCIKQANEVSKKVLDHLKKQKSILAVEADR